MSMVDSMFSEVELSQVNEKYYGFFFRPVLLFSHFQFCFHFVSLVFLSLFFAFFLQNLFRVFLYYSRTRLRCLNYFTKYFYYYCFKQLLKKFYPLSQIFKQIF
uniref:Transmembrane protein n=1 Tax=Cacopsylla melanoneura TaxID=428564 RepID=A0A8D9B474_9HEMI